MMKILVTGAAGRIGREVTAHLARGGREVVATDIACWNESPVPFRVADLTNAESVYALMEGVDVVVHLGNLPNLDAAPGYKLLSENLACQSNVFSAANDLGVGLVIFASSIQVLICVDKHLQTGGVGPLLLPVDGDTTAMPPNAYGLSKHLSEQMLAFFCRAGLKRGVSLRLPSIILGDEKIRKYDTKFRSQIAYNLMLYFCVQHLSELIEHLCSNGPDGYRCYLPAYKEAWQDENAEEMRKEFFPDFPLRDPGGPLESFVDNSKLEDETGWVMPPNPFDFRNMDREVKPAQDQSS